MKLECTRITREIWLGRGEFVTLRRNLTLAVANLDYSMEVRKERICLAARRHGYSVNIHFLADDNLTGFPKAIISICSDQPLSSIWLEEALDNEMRRLAEELRAYVEPISQTQLSNWGVEILASAGNRSGEFGGKNKGRRL